MYGIKVKEIRGYSIFYSPNIKKFQLKDKDGNEVATENTQDEAEKAAIKLNKQRFAPIPIAEVQGNLIRRGHLKSVNLDDESGYFCHGGPGGYKGREKIHLGWDKRFFELTPDNVKNIQAIEALMARREELAKRISTIINGLEKPINRAYFGVEK